jgi:hypothetical protein
VAGPTGTGKTELAALLQQHFGAAFDARHLPGSWASTGNALEGLMFEAKDAVFVIDDFAPTGTSADVARLHREADRVLRAQGNRSGRQRMRADTSLKTPKPPRGLTISTGEDVPRGESLGARLFIVEVSPGDMDWQRLGQYQAEAAADLYAQATAAYVQWLAPRYEEVRQVLKADVALLRQLAYQHGQHRRTAGIVADLILGVRHFLAFAYDVGVITHEERQALERRCWKAFEVASAVQAKHQRATEPTRRFLELLAAAMASGRAHIAAVDGGAPLTPGAWGWRERAVGTGDSQRHEWQPQGRRVGWLSGEHLYLEPEAAYAEVQLLAREQGNALAVTAQVLKKRLHQRKLLVSIDEARETLTVRRTLEGIQRSVLFLCAKIIASSTYYEPDNPDKEDGATNDAENASGSGVEMLSGVSGFS